MTKLQFEKRNYDQPGNTGGNSGEDTTITGDTDQVEPQVATVLKTSPSQETLIKLELQVAMTSPSQETLIKLEQQVAPLVRTSPSQETLIKLEPQVAILVRYY